MSVDLQALDEASREELIAQARGLGVDRPEVMTRMELKDEIVRRSETDVVQRQRARGWLGVARDLVAGVVESGLNLPDAAKLIRGGIGQDLDWKGPPPVATVTLAEIYAHQGHIDRAIGILDEVISKEPDHDAARALRERLQQERSTTGGRRRKPVETEIEREAVAKEREPEETTQPQAAPAPQAVSERGFDAEVMPPEAAALVADLVTLPEPIPAGPNTVPEAGATIDVDYGPVPLAEAGAEPEELAAVTHEPEVGSEQEPEPTLNFEPRTTLQPEITSAIAIRDDGRTYVYWEVSAQEFETVRARFHEGRLVVRLVAHRPTAEGPRRSERVIAAGELVGGIWISEGDSKDVVRVAVGIEAHERFFPLAVATVLAFEGEQHTLSVHFRARFNAAEPEAEERALAHYRSHLAA